MAFHVKEHRLRVRMSQEELARRSGVGRTIISGLESGTLTDTTTGTLRKLAKALDVGVEELFNSREEQA